MKTGKISRYFLVLLCALSSNAAWGQKTVRFYFEQYNKQGENAIPDFSADGDKPVGVTVTASGFTWGSSYKLISFDYETCKDRIVVKKTNDIPSKAFISFTNFKYEVKQVQWNIMCDLLAPSIVNLWKNVKVETQINSLTNQTKEGTYKSRSTSFDVKNFPETDSNLGFNGLSSLVIKDHLTTDYCRLFLKAGTKEQEAARNPSIFNWNPDHCYAFQITYYEPVLSFNENMPNEMAVGDEAQIDVKGSELYSIAHEGAFNFKKTYSTSNSNVISIDENGKMTAKSCGSADITMTITDGLVTKSATKTIGVANFTSTIYQYHQNSGNTDNLLVSEMNHHDDDYMLIDKTLKGFTLQSSYSKKFRAGLLDFNISVNIPKFTSVTPKWNYNIMFSNSIVYAELMYVPESISLNSINLNTSTDASAKSTEYSFYKGNNTTSTSASYSGDVIFNNSGSNITKKLHFAALSYTRRTSKNRQIETSFSYTASHTYVYHSTISFAKDVEACPFTMPSTMSINSGASDKHLPHVSEMNGHIFHGWSTQKGGTVEYENGAEFDPYDHTNGGGKGPVTLYPIWEAKEFTLNFHTCGGRLSKNVGVRAEGPNETIATSEDNSEVSINVVYNTRRADRFWCNDVITIKPGYKFLGWYTSPNKGEGTLVYTVNDVDCSFNAKKCEYWDNDGTEAKWIGDGIENGVLDLYAQYECKFEIVDNGERINFKNLDITTLDISAAIKEDMERYNMSPLIVDITEYPKFIQPGPGLLNGKGQQFNDGTEAFNTIIEEARMDQKLAPNALVYLSKESSLHTGATNVVMMKEDKCLNLEVTDRAPIKIPYAFKANKALYERNKNYSSEDAAKAQAANSKWGTLCLPYPIRNNANNVKFYELASFENNIMHYTPMNVDVIPANTPVFYKRLEGVGSDVRIEEEGVDVPVNTSYSTNSGSSLDSWQFVGTLTTKIFCGKDYDDKKVPAGAEKMDGSKEIYYFKQDQFTHLSNTGKVTMLPYRAYFTTTAANAKVATFSIVAIDEEGATDITNLIDSDAEGDGKIYDLNGRRVMQPVSGRLYIVDGKKKVY